MLCLTPVIIASQTYVYPRTRRADGVWGKATAEIVFLFGVDIQLNKVNFAIGVGKLI